jgi:hypothetical protein
VLPMVLWVVAIRHTGFGLQGRHVLPILVTLPLLAGELVREGRARLSPRALRALAVGVPVVAAFVQLGAWFRNAQRSAFGLDQPLLAWRVPEWEPPLGWSPWFLVAAAGAVLIGLAATREREPAPDADPPAPPATPA